MRQIDEAVLEKKIERFLRLWGIYDDRYASLSAYSKGMKQKILISAALLHDLGHFLIDEHSEDADFRTEDFFHEEAGAEYLQPFFSAAVTEARKLHVPAKRYICSTDDTYYNTLSEASKRSFALQGGFMSDEEKAGFEKNAYYKNAVQLRKWDDLAKEKELEVPGLENYREDVLGGLT